MVQLNKLAFPTYRHLNVNYRDLKEKEAELIAGAKLLETTQFSELQEFPDEILHASVDEKEGAWGITKGNYVVKTGTDIHGGFIFSKEAYQLNKCHVHMEKDSKATFQVFYDLESGELIGDLTFDLEEGAKLTLIPLFAEGKHIFTNIQINLLGPGADVHMEGAYICGEGADYDINVEVNHRAEETVSLMNMQGFLDKGAKKTYKYCLNFERGVREANGEENELVVALDDDFVSVSVPVLLVGEDTIQASHGATLTPLDEEVLDYIKSRGIPANLAERMCIQSGFQAALEEVNEELAQYFRDRTDLILARREERRALEKAHEC